MTSNYDPTGAHAVHAAHVNTTTRDELRDRLLEIEELCKDYRAALDAGGVAYGYAVAGDILDIIKGRS